MMIFLKAWGSGKGSPGNSRTGAARAPQYSTQKIIMTDQYNWSKRLKWEWEEDEWTRYLDQMNILPRYLDQMNPFLGSCQA